MEIYKDKSLLVASVELRCRAEEQLKVIASKTGLSQTADETLRFFHELQVHQIELEMQNAELRQARVEVETALHKYTDLYDRAPVGYFTLDRGEAISSVNLFAASLLGGERSQLIGRRFGLLITAEYRHAFTSFLSTVFTSQCKKTCEVVLLNKRNFPFIVQLDALVTDSGHECSLAMIDITERKQTQDDLRSYARRLIEIEEGLRQKLNVELHDEIGRDLTVLGMNLAIIRNSMAGEVPKKHIERIDDSGRLIKGISRSVRGIMAGLRPPVLDDYGLIAALRWHADLFSKRTGIAAFVQADDSFPRLMLEKETALFRISQEALMNAAKHADTQIVTINLSRKAGMIFFAVTDKGHGFIPSSSSNIQKGSGWGMKIMRERAELIGGNFYVDSAPGKGTKVSVEMPMEDV